MESRSDSPPPPPPPYRRPPEEPPPPAPQTTSSSSHSTALQPPTTPQQNKKLSTNVQQSLSSQTAAITGGVRLERVLGLTSTSTSDMSVNPKTGHVAYPAGRIVVVYDPKELNQGMAFRYLTLKKTVSSLVWSSCGTYLAVGEQGHQPEITVWSIPEDDLTEISTPGRQRPRRRRRRAVLVCSLQHHKFGIAALAFGTRGAGIENDGATGSGTNDVSSSTRESFNNWLLASAGFEHDHQIVVWKWMDRSIVGLATVDTKIVSLSLSLKLKLHKNNVSSIFAIISHTT